MVKLIGMLLIATSLLSLIVGAYMDIKYGSQNEIAGNVMLNILTQQKVEMGFFDYISGIAFSYSIISFVIGAVFLFRV